MHTHFLQPDFGMVSISVPYRQFRGHTGGAHPEKAETQTDTILHSGAKSTLNWMTQVVGLFEEHQQNRSGQVRVFNVHIQSKLL